MNLCNSLTSRISDSAISGKFVGSNGYAQNLSNKSNKPFGQSRGLIEIEEEKIFDRVVTPSLTLGVLHTS